jgi:hypothetical protein
VGRHTFLYPAFIAFTIPHLWLPYPFAITLWLVTLQVFLALSIFLLVQGHKVSPLFLGSLLVATFIYPLTITAIVLGQFTLYVLFFLVLAYWLWRKGRYGLAGCVLTQVLVKPQITFLIVGLWLLLALREKRWHFIAGFGIAGLILVLLPMPFIGFWLEDFLFGASGFEEPMYGGLFPRPVATVFQVGLAVVLYPICLLLWLQPEWSPLKKLDCMSGEWRLGYLISVALVVSALTSPRIRNYDLSLAIFVVVYGLLYLRGQRGWLVMALRVVLWSVLFVAPWISAWLAPDGNPSPTDRLMISSVLLIVMVFLPLVPRASAEINESNGSLIVLDGVEHVENG